MSNAFWKRTLEIFRPAPVRLTLADRTLLYGEITHVGDAACQLTRSDGSTVLVDFEDLKACEPAVGPL